MLEFFSHLPFHFLRPAWLLGILPLGLLIGVLYRRRDQDNPWRQICDPALLPFLLQPASGKQNRFLWILLGLSWLISLLALAGPAWRQQSLPAYQTPAGTVIILDMSPEMRATDLSPSRFVRAKYKLLDLFSHPPEGALGLVVYSDEAYSVAPLTYDAKTLLNLATTLEMDFIPASGNHLETALDLGENLLRQAQAKPASIVLMTGSAPSAEALEKATALYRDGITIQVLGLGSEESTPVNWKAFQELAHRGGGQLIAFDPIQPEDIRKLKTLLEERSIGANWQAKDQRLMWEDEGYWFLWLLLPAVLVVFRRGLWEKL